MARRVVQNTVFGGVRNVSKMCQKCVFFTPPRGALIIRQIGWFCTPPGYLARASRILVYTPPPTPPQNTPPPPPPLPPPKYSVLTPTPAGPGDAPNSPTYV